jgi:hypothetical protein
MRRILLLFFALTAPVDAEQPRLLGLKRIAVAVTAEPDGNLDRHKLRVGIEEKIREAGIRVDPKARSRLDVIIGVTPIKIGKGEDLGVAYSIHFSIRQPVYLAHNSNIMTDAVTWEGMWLGIASRAELNAKCAESISRRINEFVDVYQAGLEDETPRSSMRR